MLTLTINHLPAVLKSGTSFRLTRENPYFTNSGDYTLDIQLPLAGCPENRRIFGSLHRPETSLLPVVGRRMPFSLQAPPIHLEGYARITGCTADEVKVQLVAGASGLKNAIADREEYIDCLDLGTAYDNMDKTDDKIGDETYSVESLEETVKYMYHLLSGGNAEQRERGRRMFRGRWGESGFVCFPILSETDEKISNLQGFSQNQYNWAISSGSFTFRHCRFAPQPYLLEVIRRVLSAAGYTLSDAAEVERTWMAGIFVANARCTMNIAEILPHWTLAEFINEVQNLLGCVFTVRGNKVSLRRRTGWYGPAAQAVELHHVTDEHTAELDEESEQQTTSAGNVGYDFPDDMPMLCLPDEVWSSAKVLHFNTYSSIWTHYVTMKAEDRAKSEYIFCDDNTGRCFAILRRADNEAYTLHRVDHYGPLIRQPERRDTMTKLRIVPARMAAADIHNCILPEISEGGHPVFTYPTPCYMLCTSDTVLSVRNYYSVDEVINPHDDAETTDAHATDKRDAIEVAVWDGSDIGYDYPKDERINTPVGIPYTADPATGLPETLPGFNDIQGQPVTDGPFTLATTHAAAIDTRCQHIFRFTDRVDFDPMAVYLIRSRRYACLKIEYTIDRQGVQPLKTGYFYEIGG